MGGIRRHDVKDRKNNFLKNAGQSTGEMAH